MHDYRKVWEEPARGGYPDPSALALSGLDRMRAMVKGQIPNPPISHLIGMRPVEAGVGTCTFLTPASECLQAGTGHYAGGVGALVSDAALGCAVLTDVPPWSVISTSQLSLSSLSPSGSCGAPNFAVLIVMSRGAPQGEGVYIQCRSLRSPGTVSLCVLKDTDWLFVSLL